MSKLDVTIQLNQYQKPDNAQVGSMFQLFIADTWRTAECPGSYRRRCCVQTGPVAAGNRRQRV
jgi:hypothetical protein